jgi:hypothetical protein
MEVKNEFRVRQFSGGGLESAYRPGAYRSGEL